MNVVFADVVSFHSYVVPFQFCVWVFQYRGKLEYMSDLEILGSEPDLIVRTHTWFSREIYEDVCVSAGSNVYTRWLAVEVIRFLIPYLPSIALNLSGRLGPVMNKHFAFNNERGYHALLLVSFHFSSSFVLFYYLVAISLTSSSYVLALRFTESIASSSEVGFCVCVYLKTVIACRYR